jgi:hypothetical protein
MSGYVLDLSGSGRGQVAGACEQGNEPAVSVRHCLSNCHLLNHTLPNGGIFSLVIIKKRLIMLQQWIKCLKTEARIWCICYGKSE